MGFHKDWLDNLFRGLNITIIYVEDSENAKSLSSANTIYSDLLDLRCDRKTLLIAFGGGVVGDLTGFIAATYMRGIDFIQIPTTLLSQVDSSVGGKVAVNHQKAKNVIGHFYQPKAVFINTKLLDTLPEREWICGFAEMLKMGFILDENYLKDLISFYKNGLTQNELDLRQLITRSIELKAKIVIEDEKEQGIRALLNFGHTFAHAIESLDNYSTIKHGEAVLYGMLPALLLSGFSKDDDYINFIKSIVQKPNFKWSAKQYLDVIASDKKK